MRAGALREVRSLTGVPGHGPQCRARHVDVIALERVGRPGMDRFLELKYQGDAMLGSERSPDA